jgi:hypothetical protein
VLLQVIYKIDIPANRYDMLCLEGISRALCIFKGWMAPPQYRLADMSGGEGGREGGGKEPGEGVKAATAAAGGGGAAATEAAAGGGGGGAAAATALLAGQHVCEGARGGSLMVEWDGQGACS